METTAPRTCDSCRAAAAAVFCRADAAFLCGACDAKIHAANKLALRHARVWICEVCEQAPAAVTCRADAAALCSACDRDIHNANPLARRHERIPVVPFYESASHMKPFSEEEAEAASWILPDPNSKQGDCTGSSEYLFGGMDPYSDLGLVGCEEKPKVVNTVVDEQKQSCSDGVVPVQMGEEFDSGRVVGPVVDGLPAFDMSFSESKLFMHGFDSQSIGQSVSSSSLDVGVVPEGNMSTADVGASNEAAPTPVSGIDREARVSRYREKRKNRKFEKTIRYASRKAYAETRPRIKGRFAKRAELEVDSFIASDASFCVVPSF